MIFKKFAMGIAASSLIAATTLATAAPVRPFSVKLAQTKSTALNGSTLGSRAGAKLDDSNHALGSPLWILLAAFGGLTVAEITGLVDIIPSPTPTPTPTPVSP